MFKAWSRSLGARIAFLMSLAMLPLGLISVYQTHVVVEEAQALTRAALLSETVAAATGERELIQQALGAAQGLASAVPLVDAGECQQILSDFIESQQLYIFASYIQASGRMDCSSNGEVRDFAGTDTLERLGGPAVRMRRSGAVTKQSVVIASHPVMEGQLHMGWLTISIPHSVANALLESTLPNQELKLASINLDGDVVSSTSGVEAAPGFLPRDIPLSGLHDRIGLAFRAPSGSGEERFFAVAPMIDDTLVLVGSWPMSVADTGGTGPRALTAVTFPALMWVTGIIVAFFGLQRMVVRHVRQLRSAMRKFALGERRDSYLELANPPEELEEAQRAFNRMALIISEAELRQERDLRDKEVLLKEVHHRVKNNLQLIASIMNMQSRSARSAEARHMLAGLQRRVRGLAMLHRTLYTTPNMTTVDSGDLVRTVVEDVSSLSKDGQIDLRVEIESFPLFPDQAVPLSMLVTEALTNAYKYVGTSTDGQNEILISLAETKDGMVKLKIENSVAEDTDPEVIAEHQNDGLGNRLMTAFIRQLNGELDKLQKPGRFGMHITFIRRDFTPQKRAGDAA
ncbi:sensor histidine kinase [Sagittula stellata]|uniref:histidine kinase n=1 Tax=Sagittula stellata (strain ATCC 700073 / DSM 11524 / E-37) TaxID=388399 RepID=A3K2L4_SAGS3|nr:sensor histidine kinase [Sagittula stellata]EBA08423.1 periplasmic sensor signal transduction histidine kinase [Sagittula stellata E-37]